MVIELSPHNKEYMKCRVVLRRCRMVLRNMSILTDIVDRRLIKDIARCFGLSSTRIGQIARKELLVYSRIVRTDNPLKMGCIELEANRRVVNKWINHNEHDTICIWRLFPSSAKGKMIAKYIEFMEMRAKYLEIELSSNKYYEYVKDYEFKGL